MKILLAICLFGSLAFADRRENDERAKAEFLNLHFFADGRGMHVAPGLMDFVEKMPGDYTKGKRGKMLKERWGFNVVDGKVIGLFNVPYKERGVGVLGCVACHSGRAAGQFIVGLGNKNVDALQVGKDARKIQKIMAPLFLGKEYREVRKDAMKFTKVLSTERWGNLTQGMVTVAFIRSWFYRMAGVPVPEDLPRGGVKVPALWGYGVKRPVGQFSDGFGNGLLPGWAVAVELTAGQTPQTVRSYLPKVEAAENLLADILPPTYPFSINKELAEIGSLVFAKTCSGCHGTYERDAQGISVFKAPKWIPHHVVKTDDDRLNGNTPEFIQIVRNNPLNDIIQSTNLGRGYFSPRLEGIWSRFPYLHNGSVPSIADLLTPPEERPKYFSLHDAGEFYRFDPDRLGLVLPLIGSEEDLKLGKLAAKGARWVYSTSRVGHSTVGHPFGTMLPTDQKRALIEFLKTL